MERYTYEFVNHNGQSLGLEIPDNSDKKATVRKAISLMKANGITAAEIWIFSKHTYNFLAIIDIDLNRTEPAQCLEKPVV